MSLKAKLLVIMLFSVGFGITFMISLATLVGNFLYAALMIVSLLVLELFITLGFFGDKEFPQSFDREMREIGLYKALGALYLGIIFSAILSHVILMSRVS